MVGAGPLGLDLLPRRLSRSMLIRAPAHVDPTGATGASVGPPVVLALTGIGANNPVSANDNLVMIRVGKANHACQY